MRALHSHSPEVPGVERLQISTHLLLPEPLFIYSYDLFTGQVIQALNNKSQNFITQILSVLSLNLQLDSKLYLLNM